MTARTVLNHEFGQHFSSASAITAGVPRSRLAATDLDKLFHGVRSRRSADDLGWEEAMTRQMDAFAVRMTPGMFFIRSCALLAATLPVPRALRRDARVQVGVLHPFRAAKGPNVAGSQVRPHLVTIHDTKSGRTTDPVSTWASLATRLGHRDLVALADAIVRVERMPDSGRVLQEARASAEELTAALDRGLWPGRPRLRAALADVRQGSSSIPETHLRLALVSAGLPEPDLDVDVRDPSGLFLGCSELAYPGRRVAVEYEGEHHRVDRRQWNRDIDKYAAYADAGWSVVRITAEHLYPFPTPAVRRVSDALLRAGWRP